MSHRITYTHQAERSGQSRRQLARRADGHDLTRIRQGAYVDAGYWKTLERWEQYRLIVDAVDAMGPLKRTFNQQSAAAVWGLPVFGRNIPVHVLGHSELHGRTRGGVRIHADTTDADVEFVDGLRVTGRLQTVIDLGCTTEFEDAVPVFDHALKPDVERSLPPLTKAQLLEAIEGRVHHSERFRLQKLVAFANPLSDSPGESYSRAQMYLLGFPKPILQYPVHDTFGALVGLTDYYWEEHRLAGEYDGRAKYVDPRYTRGKTTAQVLALEKDRESGILATGRNVRRWTWEQASEPLRAGGLAEILENAGLQRDTRRTRWPGLPERG